MPQIEQLAATYWSQIVWLVLTFGIVFLVVGLGMVPKVQGTVDARDKGIADDLAAAEAARETADATEASWRAEENAARERAQRLLADARAQAGAENAARLSAAQAETDARVATAEADIRRASAAAGTEIENVAAEAAQAIVSRIAGAQVSIDEARSAVRQVSHG